MILTGNDNLSPEVLKEIDEIPVIGLGESGEISGDLFGTPEIVSELIKSLQNSTPKYTIGGQKIIG